MKREDFIKIIKLRSFWKIDRRKGNYRLPNGQPLSTYIRHLVESQMEIDNLAVANDGNLYDCSEKWDAERHTTIYTIYPPSAENEECDLDYMEKRIMRLLLEIIG